MSRALVLALLTVFPHFPARRTIQQRIDSIAATADAAATTYGVPPHILISVGFHETHLGIDEPDWGAPISRARRHVAGNADDAARVLARSFEICHSWRRAVARFRSGLCDAPAFAQSYVRSVMRLARRIAAHARVEERRAAQAQARAEATRAEANAIDGSSSSSPMASDGPTQAVPPANEASASPAPEELPPMLVRPIIEASN